MEPNPLPQASSTVTRVPFLANFIATGFYSGYFPVASGTAGSLVGLGLYMIPGMERIEILSIAIIAGFFAGVFTSARVAAAVGDQRSASAAFSKDLLQQGHAHAPDPSIVVIDEIVGMWISLAFLPKTYGVLIAAFLLFRIFDIVKLPPARQLERIPDGWGIMLDDVAAGVYANIAVRVIGLVIPGLIYG